VDERTARHRFGIFVIALPEPLRGDIAALRERFDPVSAALAPPHITVTQPLAAAPNDIARADLGALLAEIAPFEVRVGPAAAFAGSSVVYLSVEPADAVLALRSAAHRTGLFRTDLPFTEGFVPHVTIRETAGDGDAGGFPNEIVIRETDAAVAPTSFRCDAVELWVPDRDGRFASADRVVLAGS
jgi:2'-5' RNA ligase